MKQAKLEEMVALVGRCGYNDANKKRFKALGMELARSLARALELPGDSFDIRYNEAGVAVSGDVTLHSDNVYVMFNADVGCPWILVRTCLGRKDYTGGHNRSFSFTKLAAKDGFQAFVAFVRAVREGSAHTLR